MSTVTVSSVEVVSDFAIKLPDVPYNVPAPPGQPTQILNRPVTPFAFRLPTPTPPDTVFALRVDGTAALNDADFNLWNTPGARFRVTAGINPALPLMQSDLIQVGSVDNRILGHTLSFSSRGFKLLQVPQAALPFKYEGAWIWSVVLDRVGFPPVSLSTAVSTEVEMYFLLGAPPSSVGRAYPAALLRYFIPTFSLLPQVPTDPTESLRWWARYVVNKVFNHRNAQLRYGNLSGQNNSWYIGSVGREGANPADIGAFLLSDWIARTYPTCNCTDLAYAVSVGCQALGLAPGQLPDGRLRLPNNVVSVHNFGYVVPGPLFGWLETDDQLQCNNPFWLPASRPSVPNMDPNRTKFKDHSWVEVDFGVAGQTNMVLEATHGRKTGPGPNAYQLAYGTETREQFRVNSRNDGAVSVPFLNPGDFHAIRANVAGFNYE